MPGYARFWERNGVGRAYLALLERGGDRVARVFMRRQVPGAAHSIGDLSSPYGYGGHLLTSRAGEMVPEFERQFREHAVDAGVVCEFLRFHPLLRNERLATAGGIETLWKGQTVYLDLGVGPPGPGLKPEVRNRIRKAERAGLRVRLTIRPASLYTFLRLYRQTMIRRDADPFFLFDEASFAGLLRDLSDHLLCAEALFDEQVVAAALFLFNDDYIHYHLGGSDPEWLHLAPNNVLFFAVAEWGHQRGIRLMHLGGGMRPADSLFRFKSGFSPLRGEYFVGQRIFNHGLYDLLTERHREGAQQTSEFFPAYRAPTVPHQPVSTEREGVRL